MSFSFFNSFNGNSNRLGQNYAIQSYDVAEPKAITFISSDSSSITFSFTPPTTSGTISGYRFSVNGQPVTGTGGPSAYTISGLSAGVQYSINVVANIVSTSTSSTTTSTPFAPTSITSCQLWLDATDTASIVLSGSNVTQWKDKSGNGYNFTGTGNYPVYSTNNISFTGSGAGSTQILTNTSIPFTSTYSMFVVANQNVSHPSLYGYNYIFKATVTTDCLLFFGSLNGNFTTFVGGTSSWNDTAANSPSASVLNKCLLELTNNGTSTGLLPYVNGSALTAKNGTATSFTGLALGDTTWQSGQCWNGNINEILIYNSVLSSTDRQKVEGYLAWKWGLQTSLPGAHPYYSAAPPGTSSTVTTTSTKNIVSNPSRLLTNTTLAPFPTNIQLISATTTSLTFSFTAPTTGSTPSGYTPYVNGSAGTGSGTPSSYTISGLSAGTNYSVTMGAIIGGGTFVPTSISGCTAWWDGADPNGTGVLPANGASITTWADKSGNGYNATATRAATYSLSGKSLTFSNSYYTSNHPANPTNETCFIVYNVTNTNGYMFMIGTVSGGREVGIRNAQNEVAMGNSMIAWGAVASGVGTVGQTYLVTGQINNGPSNSYISVNGALTLVGPTSMGSSFTAGVTTGLGLENLVQGVFYGNIMEVLFYNSILSTTDRQKVEGYLAWKWSIQTYLPGAHPYYSSSPSSAGTIYQNPTPVSLRTA